MLRLLSSLLRTCSWPLVARSQPCPDFFSERSACLCPPPKSHRKGSWSGSPTQVRRRACERCPWPPMPHHGAPSQCSDAGGRTMPHARALPAYLGIGHQTVRPGSLSRPIKMSQENTGCPKKSDFQNAAEAQKSQSKWSAAEPNFSMDMA